MQAIGRWEPRVTLEAVEVEADTANPRVVAITILFRLVVTQALERIGLTLQLEN
jgi:phage baseplate assembly protein W